MAKYGVIETTNMVATHAGAHIVDVLCTKETQNGFVGYANANGELTTFTTATIGKQVPVIISNPAWNYDESRVVNQRADRYVIEANTMARGYQMMPLDTFALSAEAIDGTPAVGKYLVLANDSDKLKVSDTAEGAFVAEIYGTHNRGVSFAAKNVVLGASDVMYDIRVLANVVSYVA